jgi:hypothetical protein
MLRDRARYGIRATSEQDAIALIVLETQAGEVVG